MSWLFPPLPMAANDAADLSPCLLAVYILLTEMSKSSAHLKPQIICSLTVEFSECLVDPGYTCLFAGDWVWLVI